MCRLSSERRLVAQPLSIVLHAANLFAVVVRQPILHRLTAGINTQFCDVFEEKPVLLFDLLPVLVVEQRPD